VSTPPEDQPLGPGGARALGPVRRRTIVDHPVVVVGIYAWALIGLIGLLAAASVAVSAVSVIVVPLILALFPAALLAPLARALMVRGVPPALASLLVLVGSIAVLAALSRALAPSVAAELPGLTASLREGFAEIQAFIQRGPFGLDPGMFDNIGERAGVLLQGDGVGRGVFGAAVAVVEGVAGTLFALVALFFYLKDGPRIAVWVRDLFPERVRGDVHEIGTQTWRTLGSYFRGQLLVALVDAVFIGLGLWLLRVPLALPLAVLVFVGGLFPIVGAFLSGAVAVVVALATQGFGVALAVLVLIIVVQQVESNVLAPVVLGKATELHPLAVIVALAVGGVLLGILGAFIAVPIAASLARAVGYIRARIPG
jgi:putative heme transporter